MLPGINPRIMAEIKEKELGAKKLNHNRKYKNSKEVIPASNSFNYDGPKNFDQFRNLSFKSVKYSEIEDSKDKTPNDTKIENVLADSESGKISLESENDSSSKIEGLFFQTGNNPAINIQNQNDSTLKFVPSIDQDKKLTPQRSEKYEEFNQNQLAKLKRLSPILERSDRKSLREMIAPNFLIIFPDDKIKTIWDIAVLVLLGYTTFVTPYRVSFIENETIGWQVMDYLVDTLFFVDLIFNFLASYYDEDDNLILDRKKIAIKYMKGWFFIDSISLLPLSEFAQIGKDYMSLARLARLPRLYRVVKITKLVRLIKMNSYIKMAHGMDRIFFLFFFFCILVHVVACFWYFIATFEGMTPDTWVVRYNFQDNSSSELYIASLYWSVHAITVGFGDFNCSTPEMVFQIFITTIGITSVSFVIGSLTSVLYSIDSGQAQLKERLGTLDKLRKDNPDISEDLYMRIRKTLKYEYLKRADETEEFLSVLPSRLRKDLSYLIYKKMLLAFPRLRTTSKDFVVYLSQFLRPHTILKGGVIFTEGETVDNIYFLLKGSAAFTIIQPKEIPFLLLEEGQYFGEFELSPNGTTRVQGRYFTAVALEDTELLSLNINDLVGSPGEFDDTIKTLFFNNKAKVRRILELRKNVIESTIQHQKLNVKRISKILMEEPNHKTQKVKNVRTVTHQPQDKLITIKILANKLITHINELDPKPDLNKITKNALLKTHSKDKKGKSQNDNNSHRNSLLLKPIVNQNKTTSFYNSESPFRMGSFSELDQKASYNHSSHEAMTDKLDKLGISPSNSPLEQIHDPNLIWN